ncbi:MAG TPA: hypothetical protein VJ860_10470, partial [Polyangia bacterium]|nr:hypothetical protein [Polyangia bacterium]
AAMGYDVLKLFMPDLNPEQRAREQIDSQLLACGWLVQDYKMARRIRATLSLESPVPEICQTPSGEISVFPGSLISQTPSGKSSPMHRSRVSNISETVSPVFPSPPVASAPIEKAFTGGLA